MALRIAYIGAGNFSTRFIYPQWARHEVELAAVCDLVQEKAELAARRFGFARVYTDFVEMLERERPDAVFCVGGPAVHYPVGLEVLRRGYPLYIQKPPAETAEQVRCLARAAAEAGRVCHVGFNLRSAPAVRRATEVMASAEFGAVNLVSVRYGLISGPTWQFAIRDQHSHAIDLLQALAGPVTLEAVVAGTVPDTRSYAALLKAESGAVCALTFTSEQTPQKEFLYFEATGQRGHWLRAHDMELLYRRPAGEGDEWLSRGFYGSDPTLDWYGYVADVANFLAAVRGEEEDGSPVAQSVATLALIEEIYASLREQGVPE